tara:strand:+ start:11765 stop:12121 length:357 start_codon:yes stop_codon:yes gene_type:complete
MTHRVKYLGGFCRLYGQEFRTSMGWYEVDENMYLKVRNAPDWEVEGETTAETVEETVDEVVEEVVEAEDNDDASSTPSLDSMNKSELKAYLDEAGVEYDSSLTKSKLLALANSLDEEE